METWSLAEKFGETVKRHLEKMCSIYQKHKKDMRRRQNLAHYVREIKTKAVDVQVQVHNTNTFETNRDSSIFYEYNTQLPLAHNLKRTF